MTMPTSAPASNSLRTLLTFPNCRIFSTPIECEIVHNDEHYKGFTIATGSYDCQTNDEDYFIVMWHDAEGLVFAKTNSNRYLKHIDNIILFKQLPENLREHVAKSRKLCRRALLGHDYRRLLPREVVTVIDPEEMTEFGLVIDSVVHQIDDYDDCHETLLIGRECDMDEKMVITINFVLDDKQRERYIKRGYRIIDCEPHHIS